MSTENYPTREQFVFSLSFTGHMLVISFVVEWGEEEIDEGFIAVVTHYDDVDTPLTNALEAAVTVDEAIDNALEQWFGWCPEK